jgi:hypothetical protein
MQAQSACFASLSSGSMTRYTMIDDRREMQIALTLP